MRLYTRLLLPTIVIATGLVALVAESGVAKQVCRIADPTGTALNIRHQPNGRVVNRFRNGRQVEVLDTKADAQNRPWLKIAGMYKGEYRQWGWAFGRFLDCRLGLINPSKGGLHSPQITQRRGTVAKFQGQLWVKGTLVGRWVAAQNIAPRMEFWLLPDDRKALPRFQPYESNIYIPNGSKQIKQTFGMTAGKRFVQQQTGAVEVHGRFLLENYTTGITCDSGWTRAEIVQLQIPQKTVAAQRKRPVETGC